MSTDIMQELNRIAQERDLPLSELQKELEEALAVAYKKHVGASGDVVVRLDPKKGWTAIVEKEVVSMVTEPSFQISLDEARRRDPGAEIGDFVRCEVDPNRFGRIAAQTFKQVLSQKLREAEKRRIEEEILQNIDRVMSGTVSRRDGQNVYVSIGRIEAELPKREQVPTERYYLNDRLKFLVLKVDDSTKRLRVLVSRTHPNLLRRLLELEVPEIQQGIVEIKAIAREPGQRSKVAVVSHDERIDAVGACVGQRGLRIQAVSTELSDEKIDVIPYSEDPETYIRNALNPAKVLSVTFERAEGPGQDGEGESSKRLHGKAIVVVPDSNMTVAIGKGGQNVRLAAKLTGWDIDLRNESKKDEPRKPQGA
ncbi:MAG: transcription termination factor NusA [Fimbriimonadales bacterium]